MKMKDVVVSQARDIASQSLSINIPRPPKGWIYTLRTALGMTGAQLGERLGVKKGRISQMEAMESQGRITVQQLARAADAMQCDLVIAFRPRQPVDQIVARQARKRRWLWHQKPRRIWRWKRRPWTSAPLSAKWSDLRRSSNEPCRVTCGMNDGKF